MAVQDRVNVEHLPLTNLEDTPLSQMANEVFLPSDEDVSTMREDFIQVRNKHVLSPLVCQGHIINSLIATAGFT